MKEKVLTIEVENEEYEIPIDFEGRKVNNKSDKESEDSEESEEDSDSENESEYEENVREELFGYQENEHMVKRIVLAQERERH
jgi:hypothetical protein